MGVIETIKDMLVPYTRPGIQVECVKCGETFDAPAPDQCPECGAIEFKEVGGFELRPST